MDEILFFNQAIKNLEVFFNNNYYYKKNNKNFNENSNEAWCRHVYENTKLEKTITFDFFSSTRENVKSSIDVFITFKNETSIDLSGFLAYKKNRMLFL